MDLSLNHIIKKGGNSILIQGTSILLTLILNWLLAKQLGVKNYGIYTYAFSWVYFFGALSLLGLGPVIQRELVKYIPEKAKGLIFFTRKINFLVTLSVLIAFSIIVYYFVSIQSPDLVIPLILAMFVLPIYGQLLINSSICIGLKSVEYSLIPLNIIRPLFFCILIIVIEFYHYSVTIQNAIIFNLIAFAIAYFISLAFNKKIVSIYTQPKVIENKKWMKLGFTFLLLTVTITINSKADILMLGFFGHTDKVGIYNIAVKLATFISLPLIIMNRIIAPYIAEYFSTKKNELSIIIKKSIRIIFFLGSLLMLFFLFFGSELLNFFGSEFKLGFFSLILLSVGQLTNLFVGPVGKVLTMSEYEKLALKTMIWSTIINIISNLILIPLYGMDGAAIATFISLVFWNISLFFIVKKKLKMNLSII